MTLLALKELHLLGFVSRDVKMDNFGVHITQDNRLKFCIYDFELSQKYEATRKSTIGHGTTEYAPLVQMNKSRASYPVDDVEGWFYCLYDIFCGEIPWNRFTPAPEFIVSNENFSESKYRMIRLTKHTMQRTGQIYCAKKYDCVMDAIFKIILKWLKTPKIFDIHFYDEILSILKRGCFICEHCESNGCSGHCKEHYNTNNRNYS
ncbi:Protein kinase domain-containing protein [Meloidogyne graminicola]|uniref:Protein kinase domain-containing protein n=1 Tax=Meloidogyne graminicola TaxID=189291 RepID=A0A8S9ZKB4_9BILA|nr:Protein kinase domain-containing protein [Meloidogyne graminicola]